MGLYNVGSTCMPYCIRELPSGRYAVLNREYKPLGFSNDVWVDYEEYGIPIKGLTPLVAQTLAHPRCDPSGGYIYLYDDGCIPWRSAEHMDAYLKKLALLAKLKVDWRSLHLAGHSFPSHGPQSGVRDT